MRALEKRPEDRYQSAEDMRHDLEEFLEESGLKSGNRRMALYMQEVFAPDAATSDAGVEKARAFGDGAHGGLIPAAASKDEISEELDLDRRAPLAMRIEVAPEPAPRPAAAARQMTPNRGSASGPSSAPLCSAPMHAPRLDAGTGTTRAPLSRYYFHRRVRRVSDRGNGIHDIEMIRSADRRGRPARA